MNAPLFAAASGDDVREFAEMRCRGDAVRRLYVGLAEEGAARVVRVGQEAAGIVFASASDDETFVHELFVRREYRRQGLGSMLLAQASSESGSRFAILDAADGTSQAFAIRHGLAMRGVLLRVTGAVPSEEDVLRLAASEGRRLDVEPLEGGAHRLAVERLEREVRGTPLGAHHALLGNLATASAFALNGELVGYAYVWPDGRIGPLVSASSSYEEQIFAFAVAALTRRHGASWTQCLIPGENVRLLRAALRCGLAIDTTWLGARESAAGDPSRYVACHPLLY